MPICSNSPLKIQLQFQNCTYNDSFHPNFRSVFQCESFREWVLLTSGCLLELRPLKWPLLLPTVFKSKPIVTTGSPPSSTLRTCNKDKRFQTHSGRICTKHSGRRLGIKRMKEVTFDIGGLDSGSRRRHMEAATPIASS